MIKEYEQNIAKQPKKFPINQSFFSFPTPSPHFPPFPPFSTISPFSTIFYNF